MPDTTPGNHHSETGAARGGDGPGAGQPLQHALFRVMRSLMFEEKPIHGLDTLPLAQLRLLWAVRFCRDAPMKEFSERLQVSQSTVTQLADKLVRRGLAERHPDPLDRRVSRLRVSEAGRALLDEAEAQRRATLAAVWDELSEGGRDDALRGLETLSLAAEEVRRRQGNPLAPWPPPDEAEERAPSDAGAGAQPVVDLMNRRVRGQSPAG